MSADTTVLVVGEDHGATRVAEALGLHTVVVARPQDALEKRQALSLSLVLLNLPDGGVEPALIHALRENRTPVLIVADASWASRVGDLTNGKNGKNGKVHVLTRPVRDHQLQVAIRTLLDASGNATSARGSVAGPTLSERYLTESAPLFLHSAKMRAVKEAIEQVADTNATVLIRGESGVGKDLVARALHDASRRHGHPFVKVNCAALPMDLLESELFGHEKGAFTGAYQRKPGKFESASKGTLLLDEIGEMALGLQAKLLHVLQDHEFSRVGGRQTLRVDVRVIASTNRNLEQALRAGQFREDLYYRLNVVEIAVPPLRERREEIPALVNFFLDRFDAGDDGRLELPAETMTLLTEYPWPGNVRELQNTILRLTVLRNVPQVHEEILSRLRVLPAKASKPHTPQEEPALAPGHENTLGLREVARRAAQEAERRAIREVLERVHWNRSEAARLLKVSYKTLLHKIADCGLASKRKRPDA